MNTKYLKYAIGEIFLVVIGILIALAINQSIEKRKSEVLARDYLESLYRELQLDSTFFEKAERDLLITQNAARRLAEIIESSKPIVQDSVAFIEDLRVSINLTQELPEPVVWKEIQNTGNLNLIKNRSLIEQLYTYYNEVENCQEDYDENVLPFVLRGRYLDSKIFSVAEQDDLFDNYRLDGKVRDIVYQELVLSEEFDQIVHGLVSGSIVGVINLRRVKHSLGALLTSIRNEIKK
ncbi:MAG TPA: hypothetical protein VIN11_08665 [Roseivirga sp.]